MWASSTVRSCIGAAGGGDGAVAGDAVDVVGRGGQFSDPQGVVGPGGVLEAGRPLGGGDLAADTDQAGAAHTQAASPAATVTTAATPWNPTGTFTAGRTRRTNAAAEWFPGDIDAVRAYQGLLTPDTIRALSMI